MNPLLYFQEWLKKHSDRDRMFLFFIGFIFFYLIFFIFFQRPLQRTYNEIEQQIADLRLAQSSALQQITNIQQAIKNPALMLLIDEQNRLTQQINQMQQHIETLKPVPIASNELPLITQRVLEKQRNNAVLISLQELPDTPWPPDQTPEKTDKSAQEKTNLLADYTGLSQHTLQIEFQNDYVNTIKYLKELEMISPRVYWDSMNYKVLKYPKGNITIKFHVLSSQKSG